MMFHEALIDALKHKLEIMTPTSFQSQAIPILLEERDLVAKATPGYGKTLSLCLVAVLRAFQMKVSCAGERKIVLLVHPSADGVQGIYD